MKNKGFTLIELLAVIVILAIIALIATPIILNIIGNTRNSADERSVELYKSAVEQAVTKYQLEGLVLPDGEYTISNDGKILTNGSTVINVDYSGSIVSCNSITYLNGKINFNDCEVITSNSDNVKKYANGEVVYFDVAKGTTCTNYNEDNSKTGYNGINNSSENQNSCLKFYTFNDDGGKRVNLLLDHNTTAAIAWNSNRSNTSGPKEVLEQLKIDTADWQGTETPTNYSLDQSNSKSQAKYTVDYRDYKARLITANEIAKITGNVDWDEVTSQNGYQFDSKQNVLNPSCYYYYNGDEYEGNISECHYGWLYDRTGDSCEKNGCLNNSDSQNLFGFWTITSSSRDFVEAFVITYSSYISQTDIKYDSTYYGVRPVIEVLRSKLQ